MHSMVQPTSSLSEDQEVCSESLRVRLNRASSAVSRSCVSSSAHPVNAEHATLDAAAADAPAPAPLLIVRRAHA